MDYLYHPDGHGAHLEPDEVLRRIAPAFPYVLIDKASGDRLVQEKYAELQTLPAPEVILLSHRSHFGRTAFVSLGEDGPDGPRVSFLLQPCCELRVEYVPESGRGRCQPILAKLAALLGYEIGSSERAEPSAAADRGLRCGLRSSRASWPRRLS